MEEKQLLLDDEGDFAAGNKERQFFILVIYDIISDKRRRRMVKVLESFGDRVQKSAFECIINRRRYDRLLRLAPRCIDAKEDSLRIYLLNGRMSVMSWGSNVEYNTSDTIIL